MQVEGRRHEMAPFQSGWFGGVEMGQKQEESMTPIPNNEYAEFPNIKRRKLKTRETVAKVTEENTEKALEVIKKKRKKKHKRRKKTVSRKFIKTTVGERDKDSNLTDSKELDNKGKPVDIIVHIKMSE